MPPGDWGEFLRLPVPIVPYDVEKALEDLGLEVDRVADGEAWASCPQHVARTGKADRHASFSVSTDKGLFHCFSCGYSGQFLDLASDLLGSRAKGVSFVGLHTGLNGASGALATRILRKSTPAAAAQRADTPQEAKYLAFGYPPDDALAKRRISLDAAVRFGIRWNDDGWVLPIRDPRTHRLLGWQTKHGGKVRNCPPGIKKSGTLFGLSAFEGGRAYLVESPLDPVRMWTAGVPGGLSSYGAIVSDDQIDVLVRVADVLVVALDNDEAGWAGAERVERRAAGRIPILRWSYPADLKGKDPGDMDDDQIYHSVTNPHSPLWHRFSGAR